MVRVAVFIQKPCEGIESTKSEPRSNIYLKASLHRHKFYFSFPTSLPLNGKHKSSMMYRSSMTSNIYIHYWWQSDVRGCFRLHAISSVLTPPDDAKNHFLMMLESSERHLNSFLPLAPLEALIKFS